MARKKSPQVRGKTKNPAMSAWLKARWADPEWRAKQLEKMKANPPGFYPGHKFTRAGVPDGMRKAEAELRWKQAREKADRIIKVLEDEGSLPLDPVPDSDEGKAKKALHEAMVIGLGPYPIRERMTALKTVLEFTKQKPVQKIDQKINSAEEWLDQVLKDNGAGG